MALHARLILICTCRSKAMHIFCFGFGIKRYLKLYLVFIDRHVARFLSKILIHFLIRVAVIWEFPIRWDCGQKS